MSKVRAAVRREPLSQVLFIQTTVQLPPELWRAAKIRTIEERIEWRELLRKALVLYLTTPLPTPGR
jgi:hypothetical protein